MTTFLQSCQQVFNEAQHFREYKKSQNIRNVSNKANFSQKKIKQRIYNFIKYDVPNVDRQLIKNSCIKYDNRFSLVS